jgi:hypothetical protein
MSGGRVARRSARRAHTPKERMVTLMIEPDDWLTKARQESRRLVIAAGLSDDDIDRPISELKRKSSRVLDEAGRRHQHLRQT